MSKVTTRKTFCEFWEDYELIDAGGGKKLERFGNQIVIRPEVQAYFRSAKPFGEWDKMAHWEFSQPNGKNGKWKRLKNKAKESWTMKYGSLTFQLELTKFKHIGIFPEQRVNWDLIGNKLNSDSDTEFLNLFAYTGASSCMARLKGADTLHVDSVKQLIGWAKTNMELSRLINIRWVHEDALKFIQRLSRREAKFDCIIMDPPAWGIGAKKEKWKLEDKIDELLSAALSILKEEGLLILNTYSPKVTQEFLLNLTQLYCDNHIVEIDQIWMKTAEGKELYFSDRVIIKSLKSE